MMMHEQNLHSVYHLRSIMEGVGGRKIRFFTMLVKSVAVLGLNFTSVGRW
jgi:hypothetical protein